MPWAEVLRFLDKEIVLGKRGNRKTGNLHTAPYSNRIYRMNEEVQGTAFSEEYALRLLDTYNNKEYL